MFNFTNLPLYYWVEAIFNCMLRTKSFIYSSLIQYYSLWDYNKKTNVKFFPIFGGKWFNMNLKDHLSKFQSKSDEGILFSYSHNFVTYHVMIKWTRILKETFKMTFNDDYIKKIDINFKDNPSFQTHELNPNQCILLILILISFLVNLTSFLHSKSMLQIITYIKHQNTLANQFHIEHLIKLSSPIVEGN